MKLSTYCIHTFKKKSQHGSKRRNNEHSVNSTENKQRKKTMTIWTKDWGGRQRKGKQTSQRLLSSWKQRREEERESWWNDLGGNSQISKHGRANENTSRANAGWLSSFKKSIILYLLLVCGPSVKLDRHVCRNEQHNPECKRNKFIHNTLLKW